MHTRLRRSAPVLASTLLLIAAFSLAGCGGGGGGGQAPVAMTGKITGTMIDTASWQPINTGRVRAIAQTAVVATTGAKSYVSVREGGPGEFEIRLPEGTYTLESYTPDTITSSGRQYLGQRRGDVQVRGMQTTDVGHLYVPTILTASTYTSDGDNIQGWDWLRDPGFANSSAWTFTGIRKDFLATLVAEFRLLVTDQANGGSGYGTTINMLVLGDIWPPVVQVVIPPNSTPPDNIYPPVYQGYGTYTTETLNKTCVTGAGGLIIAVGRINAFPNHVATQQAALRLLEYPPPAPNPAWP